MSPTDTPGATCTPWHYMHTTKDIEITLLILGLPDLLPENGLSRNLDESQVRRRLWSVDSGKRRSGRSQHPLL
jgi:hypothetical protein